jgi:hypothetical protein
MVTIQKSYPQCAQTGPGVNLSDVLVIVQGSVSGDKAEVGSATRLTFGMCLWIGILINAFGIEFYVRSNPSLPNTPPH